MRNLKLIFVLMMGLVLIGCAEDEGSSNPASTSTTQPGDANFPGYFVPPTGPGSDPGDNLQYGGTSSLVNVSTSDLAFYTKNTSFANGVDRSDIKININLQQFDAATQSYGGTVSIEFRHSNGQLYRDTFTSLINENHWYGPGVVNTNKENNKYNVWLSDTEYHGFFQDTHGSIVLVIDSVTDLGDGQLSTVNGSIYVMNFPDGYAPLSPTSCWFVYAGPYDCRTWKSGNAVNTNEALYPYVENSTGGTFWEPKSEGYYKLGDFYNLDATAAFNN